VRTRNDRTIKRYENRHHTIPFIVINLRCIPSIRPKIVGKSLKKDNDLCVMTQSGNKTALGKSLFNLLEGQKEARTERSSKLFSNNVLSWLIPLFKTSSPSGKRVLDSITSRRCVYYYFYRIF